MSTLSNAKNIFALFLLAISLCATTSIWGLTATSLIVGLAVGAPLSAAFYALSVRAHALQTRQFAAGVFGASLGLLFVELLARALAPLAAYQGPDIAAVFALVKTGLSTLFAGLGGWIAIKSDDQFAKTMPFTPTAGENAGLKDILLDSSVLQDPRIYDLASTGIFDNRLAVPRFIAEEINTSLPLEESTSKASKPRRASEVIRQLDELPHLNLRTIDDDQPQIKDPLQRLFQLAQKRGADILTSERYRLQPATTEFVRVINLHTLASALRPLLQTGETLTIKVQRYGKEIKQGVGYLEDGTMVVINGGGDFLGETIKAQVLSVKHTSSGRMIFCNAIAGDDNYETSHAESYTSKTENGNVFGPSGSL